LLKTDGLQRLGTMESDEALARRLQREEEVALAEGGAVRQSPGSQALFTDEELARILQDSSPTYTEAESRTDVQDMTDEELARMLQEQENAGGRSRTNPETSPLSLPDESPPLQRRTSRSFYLGDICERWPQFIAVASSGAFFGCCAGLQAASMFHCSQAVTWICTCGGAIFGHMASNDTVPFHGQPAFLPRRGTSMQDSDDDEDDCYRGVDHEVIEGHTIGHTFHGASSTSGRGGNDEHLKCMVCMEEFRDGEALRSLPCLHRYHQRCIDQWLSRNPECPICKQDITAPQNMPAAPGPVATSRFPRPWGA